MASSLHNHTEYSVLDGFSHPKEYLDRAKDIGLKAFAVTEHGNQYSWVYFDKLKKDYPEIKMIYGVELYECFDMHIQDQNSKYFHLVALAKNEAGRIALNEIITKSNFEGFYYKPRVDLELLKPYVDNLIIMSACLASKISRESDYNTCIDYVNEYKSIFPHFYLEMQSHKTPDQEQYNKKILSLANDTNTDFVITTDSHAATKEDLYYQDYHVRIARDNETLAELYEGCYLQTEDEIHQTMDSQIGFENVEIGLKNSDVIADLIDVVNMPFQSPQLPTFPLPDGFDDNYSYLRHLCEKGWYTRGLHKLSDEEQRIRRERLNYELGIIHQMGFDGYFLFVWDFIKWARNNDVYVGDGRGSGGGAIVNFLLEISELDPITYNLIFERFLNPERVSMPDIDTDFSDREKVVRYITEKYGEDRVCQVINFSYITPCVAINDVGRVLGIPYNICSKISKKFVFDTFQECMDNNPSLYEEYIDYKDLFDIASRISGRVRQVSIHAGGVGIVDTKITDYMAMKIGSKGEHVIQVDKKIIEDIGIIKFDLLGLATTLNTIKDACKYANIEPWEININNPEFLNNQEMYYLLCSAKVDGVFQVESQGMKDLLLRLQPSNLEDVSAVLALYRPDSMGALNEFIECKHGRKAVSYIHPDMERILDSTYGCCISKGQLISTPMGNIKIEELKENDLIYTINGQSKINHVWSNGFKQTYSLKLKNGKKIKTTGDHLIFTQDGWKQLHDINLTDVVALRIGNENENVYDVNKLKVLAYLLADGGLTQTNGVHFYNSEICFVMDFKKCVENAYSNECFVEVKCVEVPSGSSVYNCYVKSKKYQHTKEMFNNDLKIWGLREHKNGIKSKDKKIPNFVFTLNSHCIKSFLGTYLDCDGCYTSRGHIRYKTVSESIAYGLQELIRLLGYNSHITINNGKGCKSYDITVNNSYDFAKLLNGYSYKVTIFLNINGNNISKDMSNKLPRKAVIPIINKYLLENKMSQRSAAKLYDSYILRQLGSKRNGDYVLLESIYKLKDIFDFPSIWFNENIKWIAIDSIEEIGVEEVFDIEVENEHNFIVNGIVVHNCIYQEQLMDIVRIFGGRTYGGADRFRKGIGKKDVELVKAEASKLYQEIIDNEYEEYIAKQISDDMSTKGGYLFNKSHSALYSILTLKTAYLKAKYPVEFFCALLNQKRDDYGALNKYILDAKEFGVTLLPPHLNKSERGFSITDGKILFGLEAIRDVGEKFVETLIEERDKNGKFKNFDDFYERMNPSNKVVIALTKAGAIPCNNKRKFLLNFASKQFERKPYKPVVSLPKLSVLKERYGIDTDMIKDKETRLVLYNQKKEKEFIELQNDKFNNSMKEFEDKYLQNEKFWEFDALSVFINNNPFVEAYKYVQTSFDDIEEGSKGIVIGAISNIQKKKDRNGKQFAFIWTYSAFGLIEVICWHTQYKQYEDLIKRGNQIAMLCRKSDDKAVVQEMKSYEQWLNDRKLHRLK